jgi:aminoethylphosphonate catabolism LysR family transcriptional regulator
MSYAQIKAFHAVARHGGFSHAARHLSLTQPAISDHVRKLEEAHGVQLFARGRRGIELTDTGRRLYTITERLFEAEAEALELLTRAAALDEGEIRIGADAAVHVLPVIARFRAQHPRIDVRLVSGNSAVLVERLLRLEIDVAVTAAPPVNPSLAAVRLRQSPLVAVVPAGRGRGRTISFRKLCDMPLILREEGSATRQLLLDEVARRNASTTISLEVEGREAVCEAVAQGLGIAVVSSGELVPDQRLSYLRFSDWDAGMEEWLIALKARANLHVIRAFLAAATPAAP